MSHELEQLRDAALAEVAGAADEQTLEAARVRYLGRAGSISAWAERMKSLSKEEKPVVGKLLNEARTSVTAAIAVVTEVRASFRSFPTTGFSSFLSDFIRSAHAEMLPARPR